MGKNNGYHEKKAREYADNIKATDNFKNFTIQSGMAADSYAKMSETITLFDSLTDTERVIVMDGYCCYCGKKLNKCECD